jgi:hypothetical protein
MTANLTARPWAKRTKAQLVEQIVSAERHLWRSALHRIRRHAELIAELGGVDPSAEGYWIEARAYAAALTYLTGEDYDAVWQLAIQAARTDSPAGRGAQQ